MAECTFRSKCSREIADLYAKFNLVLLSFDRCLVRRLSPHGGYRVAPAALDRVEETTDGAGHDERRDHGVSMPRRASTLEAPASLIPRGLPLTLPLDRLASRRANRLRGGGDP